MLYLFDLDFKELQTLYGYNITVENSKLKK
jgi:hypothetical protein